MSISPSSDFHLHLFVLLKQDIVYSDITVEPDTQGTDSGPRE